MKVLTVISNLNNRNYLLLKLTCLINSLELITLISTKSEFHSTLRTKDYLLYDYLSNGSTDDNEIILFTDGNDALFVAKEEEILSKYYSLNHDVVFSAETGCWPDKSLIDEYKNDDIKSPYRFLNSGGFIGKAGVIMKLLEDNTHDSEKYFRSNQYLWAKRYFKNKDKIALDTECKIFCTFSPEIGNEHFPFPKREEYDEYYKIKKKWFEQYFQCKDGRIYNLITKTSPCHLHFNGFSKLLIDHTIFDMVYSNIKI